MENTSNRAYRKVVAVLGAIVSLLSTVVAVVLLNSVPFSSVQSGIASLAIVLMFAPSVVTFLYGWVPSLKTRLFGGNPRASITPTLRSAVAVPLGAGLLGVVFLVLVLGSDGAAWWAYVVVACLYVILETLALTGVRQRARRNAANKAIDLP
jgi:hypothetical protein